MRKIFLLVSLLACVSFAVAQTISEGVAKQSALSVMKRRVSSAMKAYSAPNMQLAYTSKKGDDTYYYVYNNVSSGGFVIIGGDEAAAKVLGVVDKGTFDYSTAPENVKWWLSQYDAQISGAIADVKSGKVKIDLQPQTRSVSPRSDIENIVKTQWNQGYPYNKAICSTSTSFYTGCVATATAQVLKTLHDNGWDIQGKNVQYDTYALDTLGNYANAVNSEFDYDWDNMKLSYSTYTTEEADAVADLMYRVGRSVDMTYGTDGSGAASAAVIGGLYKSFGFDLGAEMVTRGNYSDAEWEALAYEELSRGVPLIYSGTSNLDISGGHCFIVDGYTESISSYSSDSPGFHVNWGWGGSYDGYFPLTGTKALAPLGTGSGGSVIGSAYSVGQCFTYGLKLDEGGRMKKVGYCSGMLLYESSTRYLTDSLTFSPGANAYIFCYKSSDYNMLYGLFSYSAMETDLTFGLKITNKATGYAAYQTLWSTKLKPGYGTTDGYFNFTCPDTAGVYTVEVVYKDEKDEWRRAGSPFDCILNIEGEKSEGLYISSGPEVNNGGYVTPTSGTITFRLFNNTTSDYENNISAYIFPYTGTNSQVNSIGYVYADQTETVGAGETRDIVYDVKNYMKTSADMVAGNSYFVYMRNGSTWVGSQTVFNCVEEDDIDYTLTDAGWGTLCLPYDAEVPSGLVAYKVDAVNGNVVSMEEVDEIARQKAYLVSGTPGTYSFSGPTCPETELQNGLLVGNTIASDTYAPKGSYVLQNLPAKNGVAFYKVQNAYEQKVSQYGAYLLTPAAYNYSSVLIDGQDGEATAVEKIPTVECSIPQPTKVVVKGRVFISNGDNTYTMEGAKIK